jgi:hypothetical protein
MPCQDVKLDRASFYLINPAAQTTFIGPSKSAEVKDKIAAETRPVRARYSIRSSNC